MRRRHRKPNCNYLDAALRRDFSSPYKQYTRTDKILLDSGYYDTETWGALKKCRKGYKIAKSEFDFKRMEYYSQGIRKFERELNVSVTEFPQFGLIGLKMPYERDAENAFYSRSYDQTQRESEDYELQLNQEQEPNLYSTEYSRSYDQTQRESEDYELQLNQEQEPNLYSTEQEPNLLKEQAEYNKRIRGEMYGAYFDEW